MDDYYAILGISRDAEEEQIRAAFRAKARMWHPDVCHKPEAHEHFIAISTAYKILIDPVRRSQYDKDTGKINTTLVPEQPPYYPYSRSPRLGHRLAAGLLGMLFLMISALAIAGFAIPVAIPAWILLLISLSRKIKLMGFTTLAFYTVLATGLFASLILMVLGLVYLWP